jgi:hypothetical protein
METMAPTVILRITYDERTASDSTCLHSNVLGSGVAQASQCMSQQFDLIVTGSGPAGPRAAVQAAKLKKSVPVIAGDPLICRTDRYPCAPSS